MVHTTVNMTTDFYGFLFTDYRDSMEISSTELVRMIMHFVSQEMPRRTRPEGPVKYQMNPFDNEWVVVHLYLTEEEVKASSALVAGFDTCVLLPLRTTTLWICGTFSKCL